MAAPLDTQTLGVVFQARPDILDGIRKAADSPARISLFNDIASFVHQQLGGPADEPAAKRRRVDIASTNGHASSKAANGTMDAAGGLEAAAAESVTLEIKDISLSVPQRKKYDLCFTKNFLYARAAGTDVPVQGIVYAWRDIEHAFYLPVPEKSQVQYNYVLFPRGSYLPGRPTNPGDPEPLVFTVAATAPKPGSVAGPMAAAAAAVSDTYSSLFQWALTTSLRTGGNTACRIVASDSRVFHSAARNAFRPAEKAVHVKAFRGSKDGFLFFLPTGILWGFKKPLMFLPLDRITAVSYTSVLQRTFNVVVEVEGGGEDGKAEEIEFAMIDQEDYQGINESYVQRHGLADRSMADQRKAKRELAENARKQGGETDGAEDDGMTELERAQLEAEQHLQDDEDEEEEDYDPGSGGESEGSGSSDDDDEDSEQEGDEDDEEDDDDE